MGVYFASDFEQSNAFTYSKGQFAGIDLPGVSSPCQITAFGINNRGDIVGYYDVSSCSQQLDNDEQTGTDIGYILHSDRTMEIVANPDGGTYSINANGINPRGTIVGEYLGSDDKNRGFLRRADGKFADPIEPANAVVTRATGINPQGEVVGTFYKELYLGALGPCYGFFRGTNGTVTEVTHEGWNYICLMGINASGEISGVWSDDLSSWTAFIATKSFFGLD